MEFTKVKNYRQVTDHSLRKHATNVINFEKEKIIPLTKKSYNYTKI